MASDYKRLSRSTDDRMIAGVCAGIADYFGIDPTLVAIPASRDVVDVDSEEVSE